MNQSLETWRWKRLALFAALVSLVGDCVSLHAVMNNDTLDALITVGYALIASILMLWATYNAKIIKEK